MWSLKTALFKTPSELGSSFAFTPQTRFLMRLLTPPTMDLSGPNVALRTQLASSGQGLSLATYPTRTSSPYAFQRVRTWLRTCALPPYQYVSVPRTCPGLYTDVLPVSCGPRSPS
jgi:hypothetical protein